MYQVRKPVARRRWLTAAAVVAMLTVAACGSGADDDAGGDSAEAEGLGHIAPLANPPSEELIKAAQEEGEVNWYTANTAADLIAKRFQEEFDIRVVTNRQNSGAITQLFMTEAEAGAPQADVLQAMNPPLMIDAAEKGYFLETAAWDIPNANDVPADLVQDYWMSSNSWVWGMMFNTDRVESLESWEELLDPEYKGEIVIADPRLGGVNAAFVNWMYETLGEEFLRALGEQDLILVDSNVAALDRLAAGEYSVVLPSTAANALELMEQGAPLDFVIPEETSWYSHDLAIPSSAPNPNAARLFADYLLSPEVQTGTAIAGPPVNPKATSDYEMLPTYDQHTPEDVEKAGERQDLWIDLLQIG